MKTVIKIPFMLAVISAHADVDPGIGAMSNTWNGQAAVSAGCISTNTKRVPPNWSYKDGKKEYTCGVACMLREVEDAGGIPRSNR